MAEVFMRDATDQILDFGNRQEAETFVRNLMATKTGKEAWSGCLDIVDIETNLRCRIKATYQDEALNFGPPSVLPFDYHVPREHWRLLMEDGSDVDTGTRLKTFRGEEVELIGSTPPGGRSAFGLVTCIDDRAYENYWVPQVVGARFKYSPPRTPQNEEALDWAASGERRGENSA